MKPRVLPMDLGEGKSAGGTESNRPLNSPGIIIILLRSNQRTRDASFNLFLRVWRVSVMVFQTWTLCDTTETIKTEA